MILILLLACGVLLLACGDVDEDNDDGSDDTSSMDTSGGDGGTPACVTLNSGTDWAWTGGCPQMYTPCDVIVKDCTLTIDYDADGGMTMGMPYSGIIKGDQVIFNDDNNLSGCTGTVLDADNIEGSCASGCSFALGR